MAIVYTQLSYYGKNRLNNSGLASTWMLSSHTYDLSEHIDALCKQIKRKKRYSSKKFICFYGHDKWLGVTHLLARFDSQIQ